MLRVVNAIISYLPKFSLIRENLPAKASSAGEKISQLKAVIFQPFLWLGSLCGCFKQRKVTILSPKGVAAGLPTSRSRPKKPGKNLRQGVSDSLDLSKKSPKKSPLNPSPEKKIDDVFIGIDDLENPTDPEAALPLPLDSPDPFEKVIFPSEELISESSNGSKALPLSSSPLAHSEKIFSPSQSEKNSENPVDYKTSLPSPISSPTRFEKAASPSEELISEPSNGSAALPLPSSPLAHFEKMFALSQSEKSPENSADQKTALLSPINSPIQLEKAASPSQSEKSPENSADQKTALLSPINSPIQLQKAASPSQSEKSPENPVDHKTALLSPINSPIQLEKAASPSQSEDDDETSLSLPVNSPIFSERETFLFLEDVSTDDENETASNPSLISIASTSSSVAESILNPDSSLDAGRILNGSQELQEQAPRQTKIRWADGVKTHDGPSPKKTVSRPQKPPASPRLQSSKQALSEEFAEFFSPLPPKENEKEEDIPNPISESSSSSSSMSACAPSSIPQKNPQNGFFSYLSSWFVSTPEVSNDPNITLDSEAKANQLVLNMLLSLDQEEGWVNWFSSFDYFGIGWTWNQTKGWASWLSQQVHREPNPIHNAKYELALLAERESFGTWLASRNQHVFSEEVDVRSFMKHLENRFNKRDDKFTEDYGSDEWRFVQNAIRAIDILLNPQNSPSNQSIRQRNSDFLTFLREALKSPCYKDPQFDDLAQILQALCLGKFTSNVMTTYEKSLLERAIHSPKEPFTSESIATIIREGNEALKACDPALRKAPGDLLYQKLTNELDAFSDPLGTSNVPEIRSIHTVVDRGATYDVIYMRHGTPTYAPDLSNLMARLTGNISSYAGFDTIDSDAWNKAEIIPEYRGFLDAANKQQSPVLYVNHQDMSVKNTAEYNRSVAIERLQGEYPQTFHFIALPFDGPIWKEIEAGTFPEWKARICDALIHQKDGFRLPKDFEAPAQLFHEIADKIHELYFSSQNELSKEERTLFLSIFYSYIKEVIKAQYRVKIMVSACKDNKDRGNASSGIDEALFNLRLTRENDPKALEDLYIRTLSPFIVKREEILKHRLQPLLLLLELIAKLSETEKAKIQEYSPIPGYKIKDQRVPYENSLPPQLPEKE